METSALPENGPIPVYAHTCVTCRVVFARSDLHRDHFKTDWHRYNLKRKMADLPTVSAETFQKKVIEMKTAAEVIEAETRRCPCCNKSYQTEAAFENHCKSKKHLEIVQKQQQSGDTVKDVKPEIITKPTDQEIVNEQEKLEVESDDDETVCMGEKLINIENCLFCTQSSQNMEENLKHMSIEHGFFIIDTEYCTDLEGLMSYLGSKVGQGLVCLWCNEKGKQFRTLDAVQKHMRDKCHCKMYHDGEAMLEYADFFDYSSSYPDADKIKDSELDVDIDLPVLEDQGYELVLPSGATIGHRSLMRYYKQNLRPVNQITLAKKQVVHRLLNEYRSIGWTGTTGEVACRKARDLKFVQKIHAKSHMKLGVKANRLQKHFKSQIDF